MLIPVFINSNPHWNSSAITSLNSGKNNLKSWSVNIKGFRVKKETLLKSSTCILINYTNCNSRQYAMMALTGFLQLYKKKSTAEIKCRKNAATSL